MPLQVDQLRWMACRARRRAGLHPGDLGRHAHLRRVGRDSNREARGLVAAGVGRGDRVLLHLDDVHLLRWITTYAAIHKAGAVAVPSNVRLTAHELAGIVDDAEPVAAVTSLRLAPIVTEACTTRAPIARADRGRRPRAVGTTSPPTSTSRSRWRSTTATSPTSCTPRARRVGPRAWRSGTATPT